MGAVRIGINCKPKSPTFSFYIMNPCVFITFSLLLLHLVTATASQLVAVRGGDENVVMNKCLDTERRALLHFKAPLQDPNGRLSTWRADEDDCCKWSGVTCSNKTGHVTQLHISKYDLEGEITHLLHNLSYLSILDLSVNSFHGTIPTFIGSMTRLRYLDLSGNSLNGTILMSIGSLTKLSYFDLSSNSLYGTIPVFIGSMTQLSYLDLSQNSLNGTIPMSIGSLTKLSYLDLSSNSLYGTIPQFIGSMTQLSYLDLSYNSLYGTIPPELGNLTNLQSLKFGYVGRCRVENLEWLSHLSHLELLVMDGISLAKQNHWVDVILSLRKLSYLSLMGCELSQVMHPYSSFLNSSSSIQTLYLSDNNLNSSMYRWLLPLTSNNFSDLDLSSNMLDGIPKYLGNLCSLRYLIFSENSAVVKFPDFLNNLSSGCTSLSLQYLYALGSQLIGSLSDDIQKFSSLEYLELSDNQLNESISDKLSSLSYVRYIDLRSCNLGPHFPKWIQTLKNLTFLGLSSTGISDTTLDFWDMLPSKLRYLDLSSNNISGQIPKVSSGLVSLNLSGNKISGGISFICQIVDGFLSYLDLSRNSLTGQLPDCLWHIKELEVLHLDHNNLFGRLPPSIGSLIKLKVLNLYKNDLFGGLPLSLKSCTSLISLNLGANKFSSDVPAWIGENLSRLYVLILRSNNFSKTIPLQLCQLPNLQILDLSMNNLHGTIPSCLGNLASIVQEGFSQDVEIGKFDSFDVTYERVVYVDHTVIEWQGDEREFFRTLKLVKSIDLSSNNLTGQIPYEITNLHDLVALNISRNSLFGEIPWKIGEMKTLLTLDLSRNSFSGGGGVSSSMSQMSLLNDLDLSFNNLSGRIPSSTQLRSFQHSRYDGNAGLCGLPLSKKCPESEATLVVGKSESDGEDIEEVWGWFYVGGGMGFATGFLMACGALLLNHRGRRAFFQFYDSFKDWVYVKVVVFIASLQKARHA